MDPNNFEQANYASLYQDIKTQQKMASSQETHQRNQPAVKKERKIGRNEKCPCGSGKKYKFCHEQQQSND